MKNRKVSITLLIIIGVLATILAARFIFNNSSAAIESDSTRVKGADSAQIKIVEYIDFQCPACANGAVYLKDFMEENPGKVRLEMKYFPLPMHSHAFSAARYAHCAALQGKFWEMHDMLVERQDQWKRLTDATPAFTQMVDDSGLIENKLDQCMASESTAEAIQSDIDEGKALGIKSTPTYFINGTMVVGTRSLSDELTKLLNGPADEPI